MGVMQNKSCGVWAKQKGCGEGKTLKWWGESKETPKWWGEDKSKG